MSFNSCWDSISGTKLPPNEDDQNKAKESSWRAKPSSPERIVIEMPENLPDDIVESVVDIWKD